MMSRTPTMLGWVRRDITAPSWRKRWTATGAGAPGERGALREEALDRDWVGCPGDEQLLHGDLLVGRLVLGEVNGTHTAAAELTLDPVAADMATARGVARQFGGAS